MDRNFRSGFRQAFANAVVSWHLRPAPVIKQHAERNECLSLRFRIAALLLPISSDWLAVDSSGCVLPPDNKGPDFVLAEGSQRAHHLHFFIANTVGPEISWRLHPDEAEQLQEMVLDHVAQGPSPLVIAGAIFHA